MTAIIDLTKDAFYEGMQANTFDQNKGRALMYYNETYTK